MTNELLGILLSLLSKLGFLTFGGVYLFLIYSGYKKYPKLGLVFLFVPPMLIVYVKDHWVESQKAVYIGTGALILGMCIGVPASILLDREMAGHDRQEHMDYITETVFYPIGNALMDYKGTHGAFPTTAEGLEILSVDNFMNKLNVYPQDRNHSAEMQQYLNEAAWYARTFSQFGPVLYTSGSPKTFTLRIPSDGHLGRASDYIFSHGSATQ